MIRLLKNEQHGGRSRSIYTTDECGDEWRRVYTTGDEYIRVGIVQEKSTYECLKVRRRVHTTGDEYIRVPRGQEMSTYDWRRVHTSTYKYIQVDISKYQYPKAGDQYIPVGRTGRPVQEVKIQ